MRPPVRLRVQLIMSVMAPMAMGRTMMEANFANHEVTANPGSAKMVCVSQQQTQAVYTVDHTTKTVGETAAISGNGRRLQMPFKWQRSNLIFSRGSVAIRVDGNAFSAIHPSA